MTGDSSVGRIERPSMWTPQCRLACWTWGLMVDMWPVLTAGSTTRDLELVPVL